VAGERVERAHERGEHDLAARLDDGGVPVVEERRLVRGHIEGREVLRVAGAAPFEHACEGRDAHEARIEREHRADVFVGVDTVAELAEPCVPDHRRDGVVAVGVGRRVVERRDARRRVGTSGEPSAEARAHLVDHRLVSAVEVPKALRFGVAWRRQRGGLCDRGPQERNEIARNVRRVIALQRLHRVEISVLGRDARGRACLRWCPRDNPRTTDHRGSTRRSRGCRRS
jgi:hypothetical protein